MAQRLPTFFISHGGGTWPWVPQMRARFHNLEASLTRIAHDLPARPRAVLMISGHWEDDSFAVLGAAEAAAATRIYHDRDLMGGVTASSYRFG